MYIYESLYLYIVKLLLWRIEDNGICKVPRMYVNRIKIYFYYKDRLDSFYYIKQNNKSISGNRSD